jgi:UBA/TS-N domain
MMSAMGISQRIEVHIRLDEAGRPSHGGCELSVLRVSGARSQLKSFQERLATLAEAAARAARGMPILPHVDAVMLEQLTVMGYPREQAQCALVATGGNLGHAVQWLSDHEGRSADQLARMALAGAASPPCPGHCAGRTDV